MKKALWIYLFVIALFSVVLTSGARASDVRRYFKVAVSVGLPPYQFVDIDGNCIGMHIDMLDTIAGNRNFVLEYLPMENDIESYAALERGDADIVLGALSRDGRPGLRYTDPLTTSPLCVVARGASGGDEGPKYSAVFEYGTTPYAIMMNLGAEKYIAVGTQLQLFETFNTRNSDIMVGVKDSLLYQMEHSGNRNEYFILHNHLGIVGYSLVVRDQDRELLYTLNDSIAQLKASYQYDSIYNDWAVTESAENIKELLRRTMLGAGIAAIAVAGYVLISSHIRGVLKRQVARQTMEIQQANREMEKQLLQIGYENELRNRIITDSPNGMLLFDRDYKITLMNNSALALLGSGEYTVGQSVTGLPVFREIVGEIGEDIFEKDRSAEYGTLRLPDGSRSFRYATHRILTMDEVSGVMLTVQETTWEEQKKREAFEAEKNRALNRIIAGIAHEIRNPLTSIYTFAKLIGEQGDNRQVQESFAKYVPGEVGRINELIENLIHYAKPFKRNIIRTGISELIDESLHLLAPSLKIKSIKLEMRVSDGLFIRADRTQIKQVLVNLIMNGVEAMEKKISQNPDIQGLRLLIQADRQEDCVLIKIRDDGVGMSPREREACTEPFYTTKGKGIGMGMALCEQYISENHGHMFIDSRENEYTEIRLVFKEDKDGNQTEIETADS